MMKNNLLITLGDSWTYGVGSYPDWHPHDHTYTVKNKEEQDILAEYCKKNNWGTLLSDRIGANLVEIASPGESNQKIVEKFFNFNINKYEIEKYKKRILIFLLTSPYRFSLPINATDSFVYSPSILGPSTPERNRSMILNRNIFGESEFYTYMIENHYSSDYLAWKHCIFHLNMIEFFCKHNDIDLYFATAFYDHGELINQIEDYSGKSLMPTNKRSYAEILNKDEFSFCKHPNERGYVKIANTMYDILIQKNGGTNFI